ncbi:MAG: C25 family cysteine peptidase, partial [Candidatus Thorarchaeota archaeon]
MNARLSRSGERLRFTALSVALMIIVSSIAMIGGMRKASHESVPDAAPSPQPYQIRPCEVKSIPTQLGTWIALDSSAPGTPAKAHVVVSDTTGMTIVADFHGFWRNTTTVNTTTYDSLDMPGASIMMEPGNPMLPRLSEHVEIPYDTDITIEVLATSNDTRGGYNIKPAPPPNVPMEVCELRYNTSTSTAVLGNYSSVYFQDSYFPGIRTNVDGRTKATSLIMRGHRLVKLRFFPVQYNPVSGNLIVFSQLVIRVKYNIPAQIEPVREALRSDAFERILMNSLLYYDSCHFQYSPPPGQPIVYAPWINTTTSQFQQAQIPQGYQRGAEYLIITTNIFKAQAQRLADWKLQKGILTKVEVVNSGSRAAVQSAIYNAYLTWYPAPTYVLLFGDVSQIPTNYEMKHEATVNGPFSLEPLFEDGYIGSDLGYFNIEGNSYFPDMIYGRISVDTVEQAEIIVNKTLQYEQTPPNNPQFYRNILSAGYFEDRNPRDGMEDAEFPFIYTLERIRHYLENEFYYTVHINYSCVGLGDHPMPRYFHALLTDDPSSIHVSNSLPEDYSWLWGYDDPLDYASARANITKNINAGRFL